MRCKACDVEGARLYKGHEYYCRKCKVSISTCLRDLGLYSMLPFHEFTAKQDDLRYCVRYGNNTPPKVSLAPLPEGLRTDKIEKKESDNGRHTKD